MTKPWLILDLLATTGTSLHSRKVAEALGMTQKEVSAWLNHCYKRGWLSRAKDPNHDLRGYFYILTNRGLRRLEHLEASY